MVSILNSDLPSVGGLRESVEGRIQDSAQRAEEAVEDLGGGVDSVIS